MKNRNIEHSDNWQTPPDFYKKLNSEFAFDFDPCPFNPGIITPEKDGLLIEWGRVNFVNPPYSRELKEAFVLRAIKEGKAGNKSVCLLPVSTSTKLFHRFIKPNSKEIRFVEGRISFIGINNKGQMVNYHLLQEVTKETIIFEGKEVPKYVKNSGQHDSMLVIF